MEGQRLRPERLKFARSEVPRKVELGRAQSWGGARSPIKVFNSFLPPTRTLSGRPDVSHRAPPAPGTTPGPVERGCVCTV